MSVLFADLVGFTALTETQDPEDARAMLSEYFAAARRVVSAYGGVVGKFIGDAVMAVWGAPVAREDDAERAVRAALDLVAAVTGLGDRLGVELRLRAGVLTGEAAVDLSAVSEGMVIGDAVNTASRIQALAPPGGVLVDDTTHWITERAIAYEDAGVHLVKGRTQDVHTWRALRVLGALHGAGRDLVETPLVARADELAQLRRALDELLRAGAKQQLVCVVGEAGLGKSRLAWELEKYADGLAAQLLWHLGQARSFGEGVGFAALADMLRMRARIAQDEPAGTQARKLDLLLDEYFGDDPARERIMVALRCLLGVGAAIERIERGELFWAWRLLFERLALTIPVVLVFEDLHWADTGLFEFIEDLAEWAPSSKILVLVLSRPDERLDALAERGTLIELHPLRGEEIEELVGATVTGAPRELVGTVREHSSGVPLFAVESLRMLANRGAMVAEEASGRYRLADVSVNLEVPASIHALIAARLDAIGELERRILLVGAVLGQQFDGRAAGGLADLAEADARSLLDGLVAKQLLTVDRDPRSPRRGSYTFVHRQVQRVALGTMSKHERRRLHLAAAARLGDGHGADEDQDRVSLLAGHLLAAAEADPSAKDGAAIKRRALGTILDAAQRAETVGALEQAAKLYDRAAEIEVEPGRRAHALERAASCMELSDPTSPAAIERLARAAAIQVEQGNLRDAARLRARELTCHYYNRSAGNLVGPLEAIYEELSGTADAAFVFAADYFSYTLVLCGDTLRAEQIALEGCEAARQLGDHPGLIGNLQSLAAALTASDRPTEALRHSRAAAELAGTHVPGRIARAYINLGYELCHLGQLAEAEAALVQAKEGAERLSDRGAHGYAVVVLMQTRFMRGDWDAALEGLEAAQFVGSNMAGMALGPPLLIAIHRGAEKQAAELLADFDRVRGGSDTVPVSDYRCLRETALAALRREPDRVVTAITSAEPADWAESAQWLPLAVTELVRASGEDALRTVLGAMRASAVEERRAVAAQVARLAAHVQLGEGNHDRAAEHLRSAHDVAAAAGMTFDAAVIALELAERIPETPGAADGLSEALAIFERLQATPWLKRARAARPGYR